MMAAIKGIPAFITVWTSKIFRRALRHKELLHLIAFTVIIDSITRQYSTDGSASIRQDRYNGVPLAP